MNASSAGVISSRAPPAASTAATAQAQWRSLRAGLRRAVMTGSSDLRCARCQMTTHVWRVKHRTGMGRAAERGKRHITLAKHAARLNSSTSVLSAGTSLFGVRPRSILATALWNLLWADTSNA